MVLHHKWRFSLRVNTLSKPLLKIFSGNYALERIPIATKGDLRAWDAADELLLQSISELDLSQIGKPIIVINDAFGALSIGLNAHSVHNWGDSYLSHLAVEHNSKLNQLSPNCLCIPSTDNLTQQYDLVITKVPKTLALLEDQLCRLKPYLNEHTVIISGAMSKHIHTSTLKLFEKIIGTTTTSRATKKARLIFSNNSQANIQRTPYPKSIEVKHLDLILNNHANIFSKDHLDIGSRFLIEHIELCPSVTTIIDLGCGNGVLGIIAQQHQPQAKIHFIDESYMAIQSAKENFEKDNLNTSKQAGFHISDCLTQYNAERPQLILCNPPFHQAHSTGDQIAWKMFKQSLEHLESCGQLWVVANRHLAYHIKLKRLFGNCRTIASNNKFVILASRKV